MSFNWSNPDVDWNKPKPTTQSNAQFDWSSTSASKPTFDWNKKSSQPESTEHSNQSEKAKEDKSKRIYYQSSGFPTGNPSAGDTPMELSEPKPEGAAMNEESDLKKTEFYHGDEIFNVPNTIGAEQSENVVSPRERIVQNLRYHAQSLPENPADLVVEKLKTEMQGIEFTRANITEGSPWSSDAFVQQLPLPEYLKNALYDLKVDRLSKIQKIVIPKLLNGQNVIAQSQSGTGKTITFLVAAFNHIDPNLAKPQVLIVLPTLELALQVCNVSDNVGKNSPEVRVRKVLRGEYFNSEVTEHIIIGTPGKLLELILRLKLIDCSNIKMVVFDEADNLFDVNQNRELMLILKESLPSNVQVVMFSATFTDGFCEFIDTFCPDSEILRLHQEEVALDNIRQLYVKVHNEKEKLSILVRILRLTECGSCFIFTQTKEDARNVYKALQEEGYSVGTLSSDYDVAARKKAFEDLRNGVTRYLVATNVSARGIDIPNVCMVINYSLPYDHYTRSVDYDVYLHRIGRCGRFGKQGLALSFADRLNSEDFIRDLIKYFGKPITELKIVDDELSLKLA